MIRSLWLAALLFVGIAGSAYAQTPCIVPNTLLNGVVADANLVMQNFNQLATCAGAAATTVANTTALKALSATSFPSALRLGATTAGDGGNMIYYPSSSPCSLNSGAGDNGLQVTA